MEVSEEERRTNTLSEATLRRGERLMTEYGVLRLRNAFDAPPSFVREVVEAGIGQGVVGPLSMPPGHFTFS